jgi:hypothetical protein
MIHRRFPLLCRLISAYICILSRPCHFWPSWQFAETS